MTELHSTRTVQYQSSFIVTFFFWHCFFLRRKVRIFRRPIFYSLFLNAIFRLRKNYSDIIFYYLLWQICLSERFIKKIYYCANFLLRREWQFFFYNVYFTFIFRSSVIFLQGVETLLVCQRNKKNCQSEKHFLFKWNIRVPFPCLKKFKIFL